MPLNLDESEEMHKVANKLVTMIEAAGGEVFNPNRKLEWTYDARNCLYEYTDYGHGPMINLVFPDSKILLEIDVDNNGVSLYQIVLDNYKWINDVYIEDPTTIDYSSFVNHIIELMS